MDSSTLTSTFGNSIMTVGLRCLCERAGCNDRFGSFVAFSIAIEQSSNGHSTERESRSSDIPWRERTTATASADRHRN